MPAALTAPCIRDFQTLQFRYYREHGEFCEDILFLESRKPLGVIVI